MTSLSERLLNAALEYAELGYRVFPCAPGKKSPATSHGLHDATCDPDQIEAWWAQMPEANIGLRTEGLFVVDVDGADNPWPGDPDKQISLGTCPTSMTPGGGVHYVFKQPDTGVWKNTASKIAPKVDTRADGGYILAPPSQIGGVEYHWLPMNELDMAVWSLDEPPSWIPYDLAMDSQRVPVSVESFDPVESGKIPSGQRNQALAQIAGANRRIGLGEQEILAVLRAVNQTRCSPPLPEAEIGKIAFSIGRYEPDQVATAVVEGHWEQMQATPEEEQEIAAESADPGVIPTEMLHQIPGFVSDVMAYCQETAPYPNPHLAFCGAMALLSVLTARKVRDDTDTRTNLYLLSLAKSASGKDKPRKVNASILQAAGAGHMLSSVFASGEGLQDALMTQPAMLFQTDEIDGMLLSISQSKDARHESMMNMMLSLYSASNGQMHMRRKAGQAESLYVDQPSLTLYGTAVPKFYYEALSERMLTNGLFSRMLVIDCGNRGKGQKPDVKPVPQSIIEVAKFWVDFTTTSGDLATSGAHQAEVRPRPVTVYPTPDADAALDAFRVYADEKYDEASRRGDTVAETVWGRVWETARKLSLLYACSENHLEPQITLQGVEWAIALINHEAHHRLYSADRMAADTPFQKDCRKIADWLAKGPDQTRSRSFLLRKTRFPKKHLEELLGTMVARGEVAVERIETGGRPAETVRLL